MTKKNLKKFPDQTRVKGYMFAIRPDGIATQCKQ